MDLLALSTQLIAADTVSEHGTAGAVSVLKPLYEAAGLAVTVQEIVRDGVSHQNLLGTFAGADPGGLLLVTHLDTVDPGPLELWTETGGQPFTLTRKGDVLYGLGSADTKLDSLCKLAAARSFQGKRLRRSLQLLGTFEEEIGCKGAKHFAASPDFKARFVSCSEPSELRIIRAHKGYAVVRLRLELPDAPRLEGPFAQRVFDGKAAHSSTPTLGVNAIEKAFAQLGATKVARLQAGSVANKVPARCTVVVPATGAGERVELVAARDTTPALALLRQLFELWRETLLGLEPKQNASFQPDVAVVNWGVARAEGRWAEATFDARLLPGHSPESLLGPFEARGQALVKAIGGTLSIAVDRSNPAMELKEPSELLLEARAACRDVGLDDRADAKPTNTEAGVFAQAGVEAIVFGPGRSTGNAHTANEHNLYSQLEKAVEFYRALITRMCVG